MYHSTTLSRHGTTGNRADVRLLLGLSFGLGRISPLCSNLMLSRTRCMCRVASEWKELMKWISCETVDFCSPTSVKWCTDLERGALGSIECSRERSKLPILSSLRLSSLFLMNKLETGLWWTLLIQMRRVVNEMSFWLIRIAFWKLGIWISSRRTFA